MKKFTFVLFGFFAVFVTGTFIMAQVDARARPPAAGRQTPVVQPVAGTVTFLTAGAELVTLPTARGAAQDQKDLGVGPVKQVKLGPIDQQLAKKGKKLFDSNCTSCHQLKQKKVGPPLGNVVNDRTPEFIMNMVLNATDMEQHDPTAKRLKSEYHVPMPQTGLKRSQARAVLEYLRTVAPKQGSK